MLKFRAFRGPATFKFKDPDTGHLYKAKSREALIQLILSYRHQNELPQIDFINAVIDNYLCSLPENRFNCEENKLSRGLLASIRGGIALLKSYLYPEKNLVFQAEADMRSEICSTCPHNDIPDKVGYTAWADKIAEASVENRRSTHHNALGNCMICSCPLRAKVWYKADPGDMYNPAHIDKELPDYCWQKSTYKINGKK